MDNSFAHSTTDRIISEAFQRNFQILLLATQEAEALQNKLVISGKAKIDQQFDHLTRKQLSFQRIVKSQAINHHRMRKIKKKYDLCQNIFEEVEHRLAAVANEESCQDLYKMFLVSSITQGLVRMFEEKVDIRCRQRQNILISLLIPQCIQSYKQYMAQHTGIQYDVGLEIAKNMHLQQRILTASYRPIQKAQQDKKCIGGVILADKTGNITFKATFDSRLGILKDICLPEVRAAIWGERK